MRRVGQVLFLIVLLLVGAVAALVGVVPVQLLLDVAGRLTGGMIEARGATGWLKAVHIDHFALHDNHGVWLAADDVTLDWHPWRLAMKRVDVDRLDVAHLQVARLPVSEPNVAPPAAPSSPSLPVQIAVHSLHAGRLDLASSIAGHEAALTIDGSLALPTLETPEAHLVAHRIGGPGDYDVFLRVTAARIDGAARVTEPSSGLIAQLGGLPNLGALSANIQVAGPRSALAVSADLAAGASHATANGTVDLVTQSLALSVTANAPAMQPAPDVAWQAISLEAHVEGAFTAPDATGRLQLDRPTAAAASLDRLTADLSGNQGRVSLHAVATGLRTPLPRPDLFADAPLTLDAVARLDDPARPVTFHLAHKLFDAQGTGRTAGDPDLAMTLRLPDFAPFAALTGMTVDGDSTVRLHATQHGSTSALEGDGTIDLRGGPAPAPALVGQGAALSFAMHTAGQDIAIDRFRLEGQAIGIAAGGSRQGDALTAHLQLSLPRLDTLAPTLAGALTLDATATGTATDLSATAHLIGDVGAPGVPRGTLSADFAAQGLPNNPSGTLTAAGEFAGAPLNLALAARREPGDVLALAIDHASWRSLQAGGTLSLRPGSRLPEGRVALRLADLADLRPFVGQALAGGLSATIASSPTGLQLDADLRQLAAAGSRIGQATLRATVRDALTTPTVTAQAELANFEAASIRGSVRVELAGPQTALGIRTTAALDLSGTPASLAALATLDLPSKRLLLSRFQATARGEDLHLRQPATVSFAGPVRVDRLALGAGAATLDVAGQFAPSLDATLSLRTPAGIAAVLSPDLAFDGAVALDARLQGTDGSVRLNATGIHARTGPGRSLPPATLTATADLRGRAAQLDARATAGTARVALNGQVPLGAGPMNLRAQGGLDLALLDPILTAQGRRARGRLALDAAIAGTPAAPLVSGTATLSGGEIQDFNQGLRLRDVAATIRGDGGVVRLVSLAAKAGDGTVSASGSVGVSGPLLPLDLQVHARNARPIASDLLQLAADADLTLRGDALGETRAAGTVTIRQANVQIPSSLPPSVASLNVIRPGQRSVAAAPAGPAPQVHLDLTIDAPGQVFVRGRGVDAELGGRLTVQGSASKPQVAGGFELRRGQLSLAGTTLDFTHGRVGFDGTGPGGRIDPTLDFVATSANGTVTATLAVGGYVSKPTIALTSTPPLPQDEVLSYLLFRRSIKDIGPFQIAAIASSLAELSGGGGANPLGSIRTGLGLDRLNVGGASSGSGASVEAGKYVTQGVYVGAKGGTSSDTGSGATVQIDITRGLKLETDVGSGKGGNKVGLTYQFEY